MQIKSTRHQVWEEADSRLVVITQTVEHNINHPVQVKLTDHGLDYWRNSELKKYSDRWRNRESTSEDFVNFGKHFQSILDRHSVGEGWYEFQSYKLTALFGPCFFEGMASNAKLPYEQTVRYVEKTTKIFGPA